MLSKFCIDAAKNVNYKTGKLLYQDFLKPPKKLDFANYTKSIWTLINNKPFFKRFHKLNEANRKIVESIMLKSEVELYAKDQPVFLKDRIGIVTMGSIEVRKHDNTRPLRPYIVKKAIEGDIIGFADGDNCASSSPLAWLISMQN